MSDTNKAPERDRQKQLDEYEKRFGHHVQEFGPMGMIHLEIGHQGFSVFWEDDPDLSAKQNAEGRRWVKRQLCCALNTLVEDHAQALIGAAYEAAADMFLQQANDFKGKLEVFRLRDTSRAIRALTPTDAQAALAARDERVRLEERESALIDAYDALFVVPAASMEQEQAIQMCQAAIAAIRKGETQ